MTFIHIFSGMLSSLQGSVWIPTLSCSFCDPGKAVTSLSNFRHPITNESTIYQTQDTSLQTLFWYILSV